MPPSGLHLFLGPDRPAKLDRLRVLERSLNIHPLDRHQLDAAALSGAALASACRQRPALSPVRLIAVDNAHRLTEASVAALLEQSDAIASVACVILLVEIELSLKHPLAKAADRIPAERFAGRAAPPAKPFAFTDALGRRDAAGALAAAHEQLAAGKDPTQLFGLVGWQLQRWVTAKRLLRSGEAPGQAAAALGLQHPWQMERLQQELGRRSLEELQHQLADCWRLDTEAKSGRTVPEAAIETLILEVCGGAAR